MALLKDYLIAWYKMNDDDVVSADVVDETGDHTGTYKDAGGDLNTSSGASTGKILGALGFNGTDEYVLIAADPAIDIYGKTGYSISVWIYPRSDGESDSGRIVDKRGTANVGYYFYIRNEAAGLDIVFLIEMGGTNVTVVKNNALILNQWSHVVVTYSEAGGKHGKIYINGILQTLDTDTAGTGSPKDDSARDLYIGNRSGGTRTFDGLIDNMMFFNKELTPLEVKYLYNSGAGIENIPTLIELSHTGQRFSSHQEI